MSKVANLSQIYTNHCVRATTINILAHAGIADREIMKITGHKCETSLSSYHADSSDKQKRKYSALLQGLDETPTASTDNVKISQSVAGSSNIYPSTNIGVRSTSTVACTEQPCAPSTVPLSASQSQSYQLNMLQNNVNNLPPLYSKQFEINNSTVQIYNYQLPHSAPQ
ncbi:KCTD1_15 [Mytilus coruscus]|uniref:KCTD1_15 n=1 Tax=Mytilus coruscus TaxID=42192 RepID=A0A6J8BQP7_MYTCO|nr:KCTD1_15 [Mytilus coruscus]